LDDSNIEPNATSLKFCPKVQNLKRVVVDQEVLFPYLVYMCILLPCCVWYLEIKVVVSTVKLCLKEKLFVNFVKNII